MSVINSFMKAFYRIRILYNMHRRAHLLYFTASSLVRGRLYGFIIALKEKKVTNCQQKPKKKKKSQMSKIIFSGIKKKIPPNWKMFNFIAGSVEVSSANRIKTLETKASCPIGKKLSIPI